MQPEPAIPDAAYETGPDGITPTAAALAAEAQWRDDVLIWGRAGWLAVGRICRWAKGYDAQLECPSPPGD